MIMTKRPKVHLRGLERVLWQGDTVAATLFIGRNRGKNDARNNQGFCKSEPKKYSQAAVDRTVQGLRTLLLEDRGLTPAQAKASVGGSRVAQKGWYHGMPEESSAYTIFFDPSVKGEETPQKFQASMRRLAELAAGSLCQDEVIIAFQAPTGNKSMGVKDDARQRKQVAAVKPLLRRR